jgi:uncharacterized protein YodC (DUF2158 family)
MKAKIRIKSGDIVKAAHGGPLMTAERVVGERVHVVWFDAGYNLHRDVIQTDGLVKVNT